MQIGGALRAMPTFEERRVASGDGTTIATTAVGPSDAQSILFIHGWSQSQHAWQSLMNGSLAERYRLVSMDMRGHGKSDRPEALESYQDGKLWGEDVAAVIAAYGLVKPILVGWSYGGYVISDYLRHFGESNLGGILFVGAITQRGTEKTKRYRSQASASLFKAATMPGTGNMETMRAFLRLCTYEPLPDAKLDDLIAENLLVSRFVRGALFQRPPIDNDDVLSGLTIPVTVVHGAEDQIVLPASAEDHAAVIPGTTLRIYPRVGHMPFEEAPAAFEADLRGLAESVESRTGASR